MAILSPVIPLMGCSAVQAPDLPGGLVARVDTDLADDSRSAGFLPPPAGTSRLIAVYWFNDLTGKNEPTIRWRCFPAPPSAPRGAGFVVDALRRRPPGPLVHRPASASCPRRPPAGATARPPRRTPNSSDTGQPLPPMRNAGVTTGGVGQFPRHRGRRAISPGHRDRWHARRFRADGPDPDQRHDDQDRLFDRPPGEPTNSSPPINCCRPKGIRTEPTQLAVRQAIDRRLCDDRRRNKNIVCRPRAAALDDYRRAVASQQQVHGKNAGKVEEPVWALREKYPAEFNINGYGH